MSQKIYTNLDIKGNATIGDIINATSDTDKFLVSDAGVVKYRTGSEMLSDLGVAPGVASNVQHQVKAGVAINKGQAVYVTSADGTNMIVGLASNTSEATSSKTMGLLDNTVAVNGFANVVTEGLLAGLNTIGANAGDPVWLGTNGNLIYGIANKPYAPAHLVFIGIVTRVNANNGEIFVKVQNGFELDELHDVDLKSSTPIGNQILAFEGAPVNLWRNKTIPSVLGYTPVPTSRTITINGNTQDLSANLSFSIASGVTSFNTRTGAITLTTGDVTGALGYTPYNASNPAGYISSYTETDTLATVTARGASTSSAITLSNSLTLAGFGTNSFINGTGDGSSFSTYNFALQGWSSMAFYNPTSGGTYPTQVCGLIDFREGRINMKGGFRANGQIVLHEGNFNSWAPTVQGGNASGTWPISITGNADTVDNLHASDFVRAHGTSTDNIDSDWGQSFKTFDPIPSGTPPIASPNLRTINIGENYGRRTQLSFDYAANRAWFRRRQDSTWSAWSEFIHSDNISSYAVPTTRTITINGTSYDLSANRSWTVTANAVETDTLATVTARGNTSTGDVNINGKIRVGSFPNSTTNNGEAWLGRAADRLAGTMTVQLGGNLDRKFEVVDYGWTTVNFSVNGYGAAEASGSMRSPIFYDSSDTGYYWNPATDSSHRFQTPYGYIDIGPKNGGTCHIYTDRPSFYFNKDILVNGSTVLNTSNAPRAANSYVMFYEGFTLNANDMSTNSTGFTYSNNAPWTGPVARFSTGGGYDLWLNASYGGNGTGLSYRTRNGDAGTYNSWHRIYSDSYRPYADDSGTTGQRSFNYLYASSYLESGGAVYGTIFYDNNNRGYYMDPDGTSQLSSIYTNNWVRVQGDSGVYSQDYGGHLRRPVNASHGTWEIFGYNKNGYAGMNVYDPQGYNNNYMHESGNGGLYQQNGNGWIFYHSRGNACLGIMTSTTSSSYKLYVGGSIYAEGDVVAYSDRRKKENIVTVDNALETVNKLRGVYYNRIDDYSKKRQVGVIAQEIQEVLPEVVTYAKDLDEYGVSYGNITGLLIEAIKEQQTQIKELKELLNNLINK